VQYGFPLTPNPEIENIFLEGFQSDKAMFFEFVKEGYNKMMLPNCLDRSIKQAKLQNSQELDEITLDDLMRLITIHPPLH